MELFKIQMDIKYDKEDYNFIKSWLNKCIKIKKYNIIYYVTSDNISRQLKYNRLLKKKKDIKIDLTKINFKDNVILERDLKYMLFDVNYYKIWSFFESKYTDNYQETRKLINDILCKILNLNGYTTYNNIGFYESNIDDFLKFKRII